MSRTLSEHHPRKEPFRGILRPSKTEQKAEKSGGKDLLLIFSSTPVELRKYAQAETNDSRE